MRQQVPAPPTVVAEPRGTSYTGSVKVYRTLLPALALCTLIALLPAGPATAATAHQDGVFRSLLPPEAGALAVALHVHLLNLHAIDDEAETFRVTAIVELQWMDPGQAFDPRAEGVTEKVFSGNYQFNEISPGWFPQLMISNAVEVPQFQGVLYRVEPDGRSSVRQVMHALVRSPMQLKRFPFDSQRLEIRFALLGFADQPVPLVAADNPITLDAANMRVPEWQLEPPRLYTEQHRSVAGGGIASGDAIVVSIDARRQSLFMLRLVMLPLALIVMLSWCVFWMDRSSVGDRMAVSFVGILTAVAYQTMTSDIMPHVAYITFTNAFVFISLVLMSATVIVNLRVAAYDKQGHHERGNRMDNLCKWLFPACYTALVSFSGALTFWLL
ncbi:MAG: hypothetical protein CME59_06245 [Halioglobus sp.]|nr:hypothetical protein [Halioglobus sp.]